MIRHIKSICLYLLLLSWSIPVFSQLNKKPNIIIILADDLGTGDLSYLGGKDVRTPHIDRMAATGMRMDNFYANSTVCSPSRASLLTGKYPDLVGVPGVIRQNKENSWGHLKENAVLLPSLLKKAGYHTAIIGKWHLGYAGSNVPNARGFDLFKGFLGDMMDDYYTHRREGINWMRQNDKEIDPKGHATELFTDWAIAYLKDKKNTAAPFFLYLAYNAPHFPIQPPRDFLEKVKMREKGASEARQKNIALVEHMDFSIGRLIKAMEENGQMENTIVVFSSDNGGSLPHAQSNGQLRGGKQNMFEGGIKIPGIVCWQNKIKAGSTLSTTSMLMDLFPTLCEVAGINNQADINGHSLLKDWLSGEEQPRDRTLFWVRREGGEHNGLAYYAARSGPIKILQNSPFEPFQLFHIENDPFEKMPLDIKKDTVAQKLKYRLMEHIRMSGAVPWQPL